MNAASIPMCNEDCLHCIYPDCILDKPTLKAQREMRSIDRDIIFSTKARKRKAEWSKAYWEMRGKYLRDPQKHTESAKAYYQKHKERIKAWHRAYHAENRDALIKKYRDYYNVHKEQINAQRRARRQANYEAYREREKAYYQAHKEQIDATQRIYQQNHRREYEEAHRDQINERQRKWRAANRDMVNAKQRAYRQAKKAQAAHANEGLQALTQYDIMEAQNETGT